MHACHTDGLCRRTTALMKLSTLPLTVLVLDVVARWSSAARSFWEQSSVWRKRHRVLCYYWVVNEILSQRRKEGGLISIHKYFFFTLNFEAYCRTQTHLILIQFFSIRRTDMTSIANTVFCCWGDGAVIRPLSTLTFVQTSATQASREAANKSTTSSLRTSLCNWHLPFAAANDTSTIHVWRKLWNLLIFSAEPAINFLLQNSTPFEEEFGGSTDLKSNHSLRLNVSVQWAVVYAAAAAAAVISSSIGIA